MGSRHGAVTPTVPVSAAAPIVWLVGLTAYVHAGVLAGLRDRHRLPGDGQRAAAS